MSKNLSAKFYQENKERLQKKAGDRYQNLSQEEKENESAIRLWKLQKSLKRWKTKVCWVLKKNIIEWEKVSYYNY